VRHTLHRFRWMVPVLLGLGLVVASSPALRAATGPAPVASMPDTLLARVAHHREVTRSGFYAAWGQVDPPARPDSLTPNGARKFLDLLIGKEALGEAALRERWTWTADESTQYAGIRDQMTLEVALDSALTDLHHRLQAAGDTTSDPRTLGIMARDSFATHIGLTVDLGLARRLTQAFAAIPKPAPESSLMVQLRMLGTMPRVDSADLPKAIARSRQGPYTVAEMLKGWKALNPVYRPRIEHPEQLEEEIRNQIFERQLRRDAERRDIAHWPAIDRELSRRHEFIAVTHLVQREVYEKIAMDSLTLLRYYRADSSHWSLPRRVSFTRMVLSDRASAENLKAQLSNPARAESLVAIGARAGVSYDLEVSADTDSALFARGLKAGRNAVLGPDSVAGGWQVARVLGINPPRSRSFPESRVLVEHKWYGVEGERLMQELMKRCRAATHVEINQGAVARLAPPR